MHRTTSRTSTRAVHAGRADLRELGVHALPLDLSSTYPVRDLEAATQSLDAMAEGRRPEGDEAIYARLHNPTVSRFEEALATMEGAESAVSFASGMAAVTACLLSARARDAAKNEVVAVRPLYGGTDHLLASEMLGLRVRWTEAQWVAEAVSPHTALVIVETPANPTLDLVDIGSVVSQAGEVPVLVDNTFATPILQRPIAHGASLVVHSATKFLGGHGDVVGGVVACSETHARSLRQIRVATGGILHPLAAYLLHRGMPTLPLRVEASQRGAIRLAARLAEHPRVKRVAHPSLAGADPLGLIGRQMEGPGSLLAFEVEGGFEAASIFLRELEFITPAVSLGSVDTLAQHPAGLTHRVVDSRAREAAGISPGLLRLSVGLEDPEDLWEDLDRALELAHRAAALTAV